MEVDPEATVAKTTHNGGVRLNPMLVLTCFEWTHKNGISIAVVSNHYILVATACLYREATSIISVIFVDGVDTELEFVGTDLW